MIVVMYLEWKLLWRYGFYLRDSPEYVFLLKVLVHLDKVLPASVDRNLIPVPPQPTTP